MKRIYSTLLFVLYVVLSCGQNSRNFELEIEKIMDQFEAVGASIVVVKDNRIIYSETFGYNPDYNNLTKRDSIPRGGVFWLASVSKTFLSTAIMQLQEKKLLSLDDDINNYLLFRVTNPYYPEVPITIRMLLSHRSSLNDNQYRRNFDAFAVESSNEYKKNFNKRRPGDDYFYCNTGYSLIAAIIENVTQMRIDEYIDKYIVKPLKLNGGLNMTLVDDSLVVRSMRYDGKKKELVPTHSVYDKKIFHRVLKNYVLGESTAGLIPSGGMRLSAEDLSRFMLVQMNYGEWNGIKLLNKQSVLTMWKGQTSDNNYGLAFTTYTKIVKGESLVGMRGGSHGIHSIMCFEPNKKYGFVIINNGYNTAKVRGVDMNYKLIRVLYRHLIK